jgi:hypothetical protein
VEQHAEQRDRSAREALDIVEPGSAKSHGAGRVDEPGHMERAGDRVAQAAAPIGRARIMGDRDRGDVDRIERRTLGMASQIRRPRTADTLHGSQRRSRRDIRGTPLKTGEFAHALAPSTWRAIATA